MAFSLNGGNGNGSRRRAGGSALSEINVTPFVDVVLVLLIIFMLTAHVMDFGLEINAPQTRIVKETAQELPVVSITKDGDLFLNEKPANINQLSAIIHQRFGNSDGVYVKADKECIWDTVAQVIATLGEAKFKVNVVTQPEDTSKGRK
jgi:biopolymer transport protein ExbD